MTTATLTEEELWGFDVCGFLVVRAALSTADLHRANTDSNSLDWLAEHPITLKYVEALAGRGARLDQPVRPVSPSHGAVLTGTNVPWDPTRGYYFKLGGARQCQSLGVVWVLGDLQGGTTSQYAIVPGSHKSVLPTPAAVLAGQEESALSRPHLHTGDMLLHAGTALHGIVPPPEGHVDNDQLVACEFAGFTTARPKQTVELPPWTNELSQEQRAVFDPAIGLSSNGERCWLREQEHGDDAGKRVAVDSSDDQRVGPPEEVWWWDTFGYLLLRGVMTPDWVAEANAALDANMDKLAGAHPDWTDKGDAWSPRLRGKGHSGIGDLFTLPSPHCDVFRRGMIAHPAVVRCLNWMIGLRWCCDPRNQPAASHWETGTAGIGLHSGHSIETGVAQRRPEVDYRLENQRCFCESVNVSWQISPCRPEDGGFVCIKGSHKASHPIPRTEDTSIDMDQVEHIATEPGDILFFLGTSQTHGAWGWSGRLPRRTLIMRYHTYPAYPPPPP